ncbi:MULTISPECIES: MerR family transcriptional regulator [Mycobacterium avium complex (MAC)]|uniref:MerR family transcriptional regulator n=1 Tax=Mycobacterium bouchedurhonense TaxID=701041 RepID=A0AAW5S9E0_MYCBC|nr:MULTISPECIES: MerR family transcriptional regulator [Mycobacterium avium complex (MAC)]ETB30608.1 MerR family transcriptional regulator [Mycobacterium avium subsp. hominissuis 10-4249]KDP00754.1 MerR family transcriptional regulator [Mycobacterium avium subsp. hominissuis 3388]MBZ4612470.1 MerR family transcriptional regulator [Mycobacterium avium subsp. hominissuis]MBZ4619041.1 MerR family transcriptional regulator [Mycobacterium avium subsp. hominissuis]MCA2331234.1 MerR family transcript
MATERAPYRSSRPEPGTIASVLHNVRRAPKRVRRQSREYRQLIEGAVSQLFDAAVRHPHGDPNSGEYRIDDLARLAGTTTRNIRVYRDRGLLPPPLRVGRIALFNDTHLTRLRLITSMLDRGYTIAHVREMLSAWEQGKNLGDVLGLETAIVGTWTTEKPETMSLAEAQRLVGDPRAFERLVALQVIRVDGTRATLTRPKLIEAFNEIRGYGVEFDKLIDLHEQIVPEIDKISDMLVRAGAEHVLDRIKPGEPLPADAEIAELITMLVRFRTQAVATVTATLASSIEANIESLVSRILADYLESSSSA